MTGKQFEIAANVRPLHPNSIITCNTTNYQQFLPCAYNQELNIS
jgi:hypothetical protein